jgi:hypothetical protein
MVSENLVSTPTKCKICGFTFATDLLGSASIVGGNPEAKLQQVAAMMGPLMKHLEKKHPEHLQQAQMTAGAFAGYLTTLAFECDEATRQRMGQDFTRWQIHRITANKEAHPADERIKERVRALLPDDHQKTVPEIREAFTALLIEMRDAIEEKGRYSRDPVPSNGQPN